MNGQVDQKKKPNSQDPSYWFKHHEERMMTDPRFLEAPADKKEEYLMRFFEQFGKDVLDKADITKPEDIEWAKQQYIATKMKNDVAPMKPDLPTSRPEEEEAPEEKKKGLGTKIGAAYMRMKGRRDIKQDQAQIPPTDSLAGMMPEGKPEGLLANMPEIVPEGENLEKDPFVKDIGEKLLGGVARLPGATKAGMEFVEKLSDIQYKGLEKAIDLAGVNDPEKREKVMDGLKNAMTIARGPFRFESILRISNKLREKLDKETNYYEYWDKTEEKWAERGHRYDETITEMWKDGNIKGVAGSAMLFGAESLPQSIMAAFGGPAGIATLGAMAGGEKYQSLKEMGVEEGTALLNATITGILEGVTELSTGALGSLIKNAYKKIGKEAAEELVKTGLRSWMTAIYKKVGIYTAPIQEGIEEYINQIGGNITDKLTGVDPDRKIGEGGFDSFMAGVGGGIYFTAMGVPAEIAKAVKPKKEVKPKEEVKPPFDFATIQVAPEIKEAARVLREEQEKFVAGLKLTPEVEEFYKEKKRIEAERFDYDLEQTQKEMGLPGTPNIEVPNSVEETLDKVDAGEPVVNESLKETSDFLYDEYKRLEALKEDPGRVYTREQIESMQEFLGVEITNLNERINEQKETGEFVTREIDLTDEITVSEITEIGEEPAPAEEAAPAEEVAPTTFGKIIPGNKGKRVFIKTLPRTAEEDPNVIADPLAVQLAEARIEKLIQKSKSLDDFSSRLTYSFALNDRQFLNAFVEARIAGETTQPFSEWRNMRDEPEAPPAAAAPPAPPPVTDVEEKLGPPEQAGSILAGEFAKVVSDVETAYGERAGELEKKRDELTARIQEEFGDAVTLGSKELEQQIVEIDNQLAEIFNQEAGELEDYSARIEQPLKDLVKRFEPEYTEDQTNEALSAAWQIMRDPEGIEEDMTITEVVSRAIDVMEGREPGVVAPPAPEGKIAKEEVAEIEETQGPGFREVEIQEDLPVGAEIKTDPETGKEYTDVPPREEDIKPVYDSEAEQWRAEGKRTVLGTEHVRQEPLEKVVEGKPAIVRFSKREQPEGSYALIEAADLQPSHQSGMENLVHFIPEAQPRNRGNLLSLADAAREKAMNLDPEQMGYAPNAYTGAPIINTRGEVIQGNGRAEAIKYYYDTLGDTKGYAQYLKDNADMFGITPGQIDQFDNPVLVRKLDVDDEQAIRLGNFGQRDLEDVQESTADIKQATNRLTTEQGTTLSNILLKGNEADDTIKSLIRKNKDELLDRMTAFGVFKQGDAERFVRNNELTAEGVSEIENIFRGLFLKGGNVNLMERFGELPNSSTNPVQAGISKSIPTLLRIPTEKSILPQVRNALAGLYEFDQHYRASKDVTFDGWLRQSAMFEAPISERYTPFEIELMRMMHTAKKQNDIVQKFKEYEVEVKGKEADMFEPARPGVSREEAVKNVFGVEFSKTIDNEYEETEAEKEPEVRAEPVRPGVDIEPEAREEAEEAPPAEEPEVKIVDLKDDLNDMLGLLGDLEDPNEPTKLSQGTSTKADASAKMLQASMKLVDKVIQTGKFRFDQVLEEVIPSLPRPQLEALLPHLKSGYMGYAANAAPDVQEQMDLARTLSFDNKDLDVLIGQMFRPTETPDTFEDLVDKHFYIPAAKKTFYIYRIEQWDDPKDAKVNMIKGSLFEGMPDEMEKLQVAIIGESIAGEPPQGATVEGVRQAIKEGKVKEVPPYENDEYRKELEEVMDIYLSMGDPTKAEQTRRRIQVEPRDIDGNTVPWQEKAADMRKAAESTKRTYDLLAGKVMYQPIPYVAIALQEVNDAVDSTVKKGPPLSPFIREALTPAQLDRFLTAYREAQKINAQIGLTERDLRWGMTFSDYQASASIGALTAVGIKARMLAEGDKRASEKKLKDAIKALEESLDKSEEQIRKIKERGLEWEIKNLAWTGQMLPTEDALYDLGKKWGVTDKGRIADIADLAKVKMARTINVDLTLSQLDRYSQVMAMRQSFPVYDPARIKDHEPSTDIVLSQLINEYLNASQVSNIVDPIAGNGSRVIGAPTSRIRVNEQNPQKIENLQSMGVWAYKEDPLKGVVGKMDIRRTPAMVISPLTVKDPTEVIKANLKDLSNDGKAVLILPGNVTQKELGKPFYSWLYKHYNVQDNIQLDGSMNNGNESHAILINGRKADPFEELPTDADFATVDEWPTLQGRILSLTLKPNEKSVLQPKVDADRGSDNLVDGGTSPGIPDKENIRPDSTVPGEAAETPPAGEPPKEGEPTGDTAGPSPREGRERTDETDPGQPSIPIPSVGTRPAGGGGRPTFGTLRPKRDPVDLPTNNIGQPDQRTKRDLGINQRSGDEQTPYVPLSRLGSGNYVTPASIAPEVERALLQLRNHIGDVDQYVMSKLKYPSVESMTSAFYAEQVDGVAQSIFNIEGGNSMIIGHQTGTGKGRIAAATIRYAIENGKMPVFVTKSADLFSDMFRDLLDIGSPDYQPWMMNKAFATGRPTEIVNLNSAEKEILHRVDPDANTKIIGTDKVKGTGQLPDGTDFVMTTYSQFNDPQGSIHRRNFLMDLAQREDVVFIMDESHDASGDGSTNEFFTQWIPETQGGLFASATYAKRPDNMPIYALKTVLQEARMEWPDMLLSIQKGGTALQEIITRQLAASGQFSKLGFRFDAETNYLVLGDTDSSQRTYDPDLGTEMVEKYDKVSYSLRQIIQFQKDFIHPEVERANNLIIKYHQDNNMELGQAGAIKQHYSAQAWNILDQLLLALKVVDSVPLIVEDLKKGIKPVIALKSTMEALFADMVENGLLTKGETIDLNFSNVLKRGMRAMFRYTEKDSDGNSTVKHLEPNDLSNEAQQVLASIDEVIDLMVENKELDIPVTPIDVMRKGIEDAGFEVVEITGRKTQFELNTEMTKGKFKSKPRTNKIEALDRFNNTQGVAAIINTAGATGVSMHSSPKYQDLSQRSMYVLQNDMNINTVVQMLGRVYRANQVNKPIYNFMTTRLPAEMRMFLLNTKKLKSLDANTSGNQKQSSSIAAVKDFPDYLNKYGDKVIVEYLNENRDVNLALGDPIGIDKGRVQEGGAAHKVSGKIMLLTSDQQEQFNNDILQRYNAEIDFQNTHGTNDLEVKTEELDAEIQGTEIAIPGKGGVSDFGKSTVLSKANVLITDNPLSKRDIEERLAEVPDDHVEQMRKEMEQGIEDNLNETLNSITNKYDDLRAMWKKRIVDDKDIAAQDKQKQLDSKWIELNGLEISAIERAKATVRSRKKDFNELLDYFTPGQGLEVPLAVSDEMAINRTVEGVFLRFRINKNRANPWIPSNFVLEFATNDSRKVAQIPSSKEPHLRMIMKNSSQLNPNQSQGILDRWDETRPPEERGTRWIVTGNILQAMPMFGTGRLIEFNKKDGTIDVGLRMPDDWIKPDQRSANIPINTATEIIRKLDVEEMIEDVTGHVMIKKRNHGDPQMYDFMVPTESRFGKKYYTNERVKDLMEYGKMEDNGPFHIGMFRETRLQEVLDALQEEFDVIIEASNQQAGRALGQTQHENTMEQNGVPATSKAKSRGYSPNPQTFTQGSEEKRVGTRIPAAPILGKKPKPIHQIQYDLGWAVGYRTRYVRRGLGKGVAGQFQPGSGRVAIKFEKDLDTTAHEIGHAMDLHFGLLAPNAPRAELQTELSQLWQFGSDPDPRHPNPEQYRMMEGMAEFIRAWMVNPDETKRRFPKTYQWFESKVSREPDIWNGLLQFSDDIRTWWGSETGDQIISNIFFDTPKKASVPKVIVNSILRRELRQGETEHGQFILTPWDNWAQKYTNMFRPLERVWKYAMAEQGIDIQDYKKLKPTQNFEIMARLFLGLNSKLNSAYRDGLIDFHDNRVYDSTRKENISFKLLMKQIPNHVWKDMDANMKEAIKLGMAERIMEVPWKLEHKQIILDLQNTNKIPPPDVWRDHSELLEEKYGHMIDAVTDRLAKGEITAEEAYHPEDSYRKFYRKRIFGIEDTIEILGRKPGEEKMNDYQKAKKYVEEFEKREAADPEAVKWIRDFNEIYRDIGEQVVKYAYESGMITEDVYNDILATNTSYMAMHRLFAATPEEMTEGRAMEGFSVAQVSTPSKSGRVDVLFKGVKGSERLTKDPVGVLMDSYQKVVEYGDRNHVIKLFANAFDQTAFGPEPELYEAGAPKMGEIAWRSSKPGENSIPYRAGGKQMYLNFADTEMFRLFNKMMFTEAKKLPKILTALPQWLRKSVVTAPVFALRNVIRDVRHFVVFGEGIQYLPGVIRDASRDALHQVFKKGTRRKEIRAAFEAHGGGQFGYMVTDKVAYAELQRQTMFEISKDPRKVIYGRKETWKFFQKSVSAGLSGFEKATRMLQFRASIKKAQKEYGLSEAEAMTRAAYQARDLMDFMVGGEITKQVNQAVIFLNPAIRGWEKIFRVLKNKKTRNKVLMRMMFWQVGGGILNSAVVAMFGSDDDKEEYLNAPAYQRDMYDRYPIGGGNWIFIPRPFELASITSLAQRATDKILFNDPNAFNKEYMKSLGHILLPTDMPGIFSGYSGAINAIGNYDFFRQKHIIPPADVNTPIAGRNYDYASKFSKLLMKGSDLYTPEKDHYKLDPRHVDAFISGQFSYYGNFFLKMTEAILPGEAQEKFKLNVGSTGFVRQAFHYGEPDVQWVIRAARDNKELQTSPDYENLRNQISKYFEKETMENKDRRREVGAQMRKDAQRIRKDWEPDMELTYTRQKQKKEMRGQTPSL